MGLDEMTLGNGMAEDQVQGLSQEEQLGSEELAKKSEEKHQQGRKKMIVKGVRGSM